MRKVEFHPEAIEELLQAKEWYESQTEGLGSEFVQEVEKAIQYIQEFPETWPLYFKEVQRFLIHRFPFGILYQQHQEDLIHILAVMNLRRKPGYWKTRK